MPSSDHGAAGEPDKPVILWFRRDLRLRDNPALLAAVETGRPIIPLFVLQEAEDIRLAGAASLWWLDKSLRVLKRDLERLGSTLVLRRGDAAQIVLDIVERTGAASVYWNRLYDGGAVKRDTSLKTDLIHRGVEAKSFNSGLLIEPWALKTKTGGPFKVFTPFWKTMRPLVGDFTLHKAPESLRSPPHWPSTDTIDSWRLHPMKPDWSSGFDFWTPGEPGAHQQLHQFIQVHLGAYPAARDEPASDGTSRLSPHLHWGEIGPRQVWRDVDSAAHRHPALEPGADKFLSELAWRDFNHGILFHHPDLPSANYKPTFDAFPWSDNPRGLAAWKVGQTGYPMVDAGMRELWKTGFMHNRVRMIAASFLIKHLLIDWRIGEQWFWDTLVDADEANNPANWQWVAGSGADAAPFFRIFSPMGQGDRFDPGGGYVRRWVPELGKLDDKYIHAPWTAPDYALAKAGVKLGQTYPKPVVDHDTARKRALDAFKGLKDG
jgi:deoxyribodipyrimidine photo-lyase